MRFETGGVVYSAWFRLALYSLVEPSGGIKKHILRIFKDPYSLELETSRHWSRQPVSSTECL